MQRGNSAGYGADSRSPLVGIDETSGLSLEEALGGVFSCRRCKLALTRTNVVPGEGKRHARVMLIGEAPGKNEDLQGRPFVGAAGNLLNQTLERVGLSREDIYIANILKCRPPKNRDPRPEEIETCTPWLVAQIAAVFPAVIVTMGNFSTRFILGTNRGISGLRGTVHRIGPFSVIPTFHPAAAIYDRNKVPTLENDFGLVAQVMRDVEQQRAREQEPAGAGAQGQDPAGAPDGTQEPAHDPQGDVEQMHWNLDL